MLKRRLLLCWLLALMVCSAARADRVRVWEEPLTLPTYAVGPADVNPRFFDGRGYQGAKGPVYPYPMLDVLTQDKADETYTALYLENEYVRFCVLPEIGGRLFEAYDKTNDHHFFYRQHVIKPDLIGMLGAWISGGVEWCVFHHHRNTTFMPVDWRLAENEDGSKTIWIGETERRHRMKWLMGMTLHPDASRLDVTVKLFNDTPYVNSFLYWANVAIHATDGYQVIFPPSTQFATFHGKNQFTRWPISHEKFNGMDYTEGVDVTWWKNHPKPTSFFAWNAQEDFFAGYDHDKHAGVVHVADHHVAPGMKLWTWGTQSTWDRTKLTDDDGPYAEIMVGAYSDNQPDYSWIQPHEVKVFTQSWYPLRGLDGCLNATREGAVNLTVSDEGAARVAFNAAGTHKKARAVLYAGDAALLDKTIAIGPAAPFAETVALPAGVAEADLRAVLYDAEGNELVAYRKTTYPEEPMPEAVTPPPPPAEIATNEELVLAGQRLQQFYNPTMEPRPYYEEALERDPDDVRANTALAIDECRRGLYKSAEARLNRAVARLTKNHTRPMDGAPHYYLGVALEGQERYAEAYDAYSRAAWNMAWHSAANYALAGIDCRRGDFEKALEHAGNAIATDMLDAAARNLRAAILRHLDRAEEAKEQAEANCAFDPLDFWAANELVLAERARNKKHSATRALERIDYAHARRGRVLSRIGLEIRGKWPLRGSVRRFDAAQRRRFAGNLSHALLPPRLLQSAAGPRQPVPAALLPNRREHAFRVLFPVPARRHLHPAPCHLGVPRGGARALLPGQSALRLAAGGRGAGVGGGGRARRQPGHGAPQPGLRLREAREATTPRRLRPTSARSPATTPIRASSTNSNSFTRNRAPRPRCASRCSAPTRRPRTNAATSPRARFRFSCRPGSTAPPSSGLAGRHFDTWEGGTGIHDTYVEAHILRGRGALEAGDAAAALRDFEAALEYPANLGVDRPAPRPARRAHAMLYRGGLRSPRQSGRGARASRRSRQDRSWGERVPLLQRTGAGQTGPRRRGQAALRRARSRRRRPARKGRFGGLLYEIRRKTNARDAHGPSALPRGSGRAGQRRCRQGARTLPKSA